MKTLISCISLFLMLFTQVHAEVTITLPNNSTPLLLNGKDIDTRQLISANGTQQILLNANANYREFGQQKRFVSEAIIVTFSGENNHYTLSLPKISTPKAAETFNQSPQVIVKDTKGNNIPYKIDTLVKEGIQVGRNYSEEIKTYNTGQGIAAVSLWQVSPTSTVQQASSAAQATETVTETSHTITETNHTSAEASVEPVKNVQGTQRKDQINVGQMLDFWYEQADEATREAFKKRIGLETK